MRGHSLTVNTCRAECQFLQHHIPLLERRVTREAKSVETRHTSQTHWTNMKSFCCSSGTFCDGESGPRAWAQRHSGQDRGLRGCASYDLCKGSASVGVYAHLCVSMCFPCVCMCAICVYMCISIFAEYVANVKCPKLGLAIFLSFLLPLFRGVYIKYNIRIKDIDGRKSKHSYVLNMCQHHTHNCIFIKLLNCKYSMRQAFSSSPRFTDGEAEAQRNEHLV